MGLNLAADEECTGADTQCIWRKGGQVDLVNSAPR
jgi:hypothetical protein